MNQFIAKGREAIETARTGGYVYDEQRQLSWKINNPIERDAKNFNRAYDDVIDALNSTRCQ
jgi:protein-tyrosine-phosphatase